MSKQSKEEIAEITEQNKRYIVDFENDGAYTKVYDNIITLMKNTTWATIFSHFIWANNHFGKHKAGYQGEFYQTHKQIMNKFLCISEDTITRAVKKFIDLGLMEVVKKKGNSGELSKNWYRLNFKFISEVIHGDGDSARYRHGDSARCGDKEITNTDKEITNKSSKEDYRPEGRRSFKTILVNGKRMKFTPDSKTIPDSEPKNNVNPDLKLNPDRGPKERINPDKENTPAPKPKRVPVPGKPLSANKEKQQDELDKMSADANKKAPPKAEFTYTHEDRFLYNELISLGATKHKEDSITFYRTMDAIHRILTDKCNNPYNGVPSIHVDYKLKNWTYDEVIALFKYQMGISAKPVRNFAQFSFTFNPVTKMSWSPMVALHKAMKKNSVESLDSAGKLLIKELQRVHADEGIDAQSAKRLIGLLDLYCNGYTISPQLNHLYFGNPIYAFTEHVNEKMRNSDFKPVYMKSEKFIDGFVKEFKQRGVFV